MLNLDKIKKEYRDTTQELSSPDIFKDKDRYQNLSKRFAFLEKVVNLIKLRQGNLDALENLHQVLSDQNEEQTVKEMAVEEVKLLKEKVFQLEEDIEDLIFQADEPDRDVIIEMRAAAGGQESSLFVGSLFKMYSKYAESKGWRLEILSSHPTELGGFKEIIFSVKGEGVYVHLKFESGVHRVQRVPVTESGGRIHTSTATVAVLVEPKEVDLKITPDEIKIDTFRASGAGGQHVNVTDSAVRITHLPTQTIVTCQDERSQIKNREKALRVLKARILEKIMKENTDKMVKERRTQIGTGDRSEKIRTYNFPERRVTEHRINFTVYRLEAVLEGDLDEIVKKLIKAEREKLYENKGLA